MVRVCKRCRRFATTPRGLGANSKISNHAVYDLPSAVGDRTPRPHGYLWRGIHAVYSRGAGI